MSEKEPRAFMVSAAKLKLEFMRLAKEAYQDYAESKLDDTDEERDLAMERSKLEQEVFGSEPEKGKP